MNTTHSTEPSTKHHIADSVNKLLKLKTFHKKYYHKNYHTLLYTTLSHCIITITISPSRIYHTITVITISQLIKIILPWRKLDSCKSARPTKYQKTFLIVSSDGQLEDKVEVAGNKAGDCGQLGDCEKGGESSSSSRLT